MSDRIEKTIELKAPVSRVWKALTDHHEFGKWFKVRLEGPFAPPASAARAGSRSTPSPSSTRRPTSNMSRGNGTLHWRG